MFEQLVLVDHPNIVKLHKYWLDASEARARVSHWHVPAQARGGWGRAQLGGWGWEGPTCSWWSPPAPQVIFITEYVSSGSLKQFLKKTKKNHKAMNARVRGVGWDCIRDVSEGSSGNGNGLGPVGWEVGVQGEHHRPSRLSAPVR